MKRKTLKEFEKEHKGNPSQEQYFKWLDGATPEQLRDFITAYAHNVRLRTKAELVLGKKLNDPPWKRTGALVVSLLAMVFAGISSWPVLREWLPAVRRERKDSNSQPPQSHLGTTTAPPPQASQNTNASPASPPPEPKP